MACQGLLHNYDIARDLWTKPYVDAYVKKRLPLLSPGIVCITLWLAPEAGIKALLLNSLSGSIIQKLAYLQ